MEISFQHIYKYLRRFADTEARTSILAIDGRCSSGKTTLGNRLAAKWNVPLFHMDDYYLQPHQRIAERLAEPGGNVDRERFMEEVLLPLKAGSPVLCRRFNCKTLSFDPAKTIEPAELAIVEGSYSCHPMLRDHYDLRIFLDISPEEQLRRIILRNGPETAERFRTVWIPLEESYFSVCRVREACEIYVKCE